MNTDPVVPDTVGPFTTLQQVFDRVWQWAVVEKNGKCGDDGRCYYRNPSPTSEPGGFSPACFIGACIPDSVLRAAGFREDEDTPVGDVVRLMQEYPAIRSHFGNIDDFALLALQEIHDLPGQFQEAESRLRQFARDSGLTVPA